MNLLVLILIASSLLQISSKLLAMPRKGGNSRGAAKRKSEFSTRDGYFGRINPESDEKVIGQLVEELVQKTIAENEIVYDNQIIYDIEGDALFLM